MDYWDPWMCDAVAGETADTSAATKVIQTKYLLINTDSLFWQLKLIADVLPILILILAHLKAKMDIFFSFL